jgi:hypothetical protein
MRGARHYRPDVPTRLKKCSEHIGDDCTLCCAVTPCAYCLELEIYGEPIKHGYAPESADHWTGTVGSHSFDAFWERNYQTDECEFVVELDGVEVYRKSCYEGQECRDSSDETGVTIGYDEATLRWIKHEPLPLPHIIGDEGCPTWFCGECECSCECVCVTITEPDSTVITGELCNVAYDCEGPRWEGQIGYYDLALALGRDSYGNCVLESTIDGEEQAAVAVVGCKDMAATITLYDGTTIVVACKICSCDTFTEFDMPFCLCSPMRDVYSVSVTGGSYCPFTFSGDLTYDADNIVPTWKSGSFTINANPDVVVELWLQCISAPPGVPDNGFTAEDLLEVNSGYWYEITLVRVSNGTVYTTGVLLYYKEENANGWVGRCAEPFVIVSYINNETCDGVVGHSDLITVLITE